MKKIDKLIRVSDVVYATVRRLAWEQRVSQGAIVADMLAAYLADPRTPEQRAQDEHAAQVEDTQASDRP